ncbi:MAG: methionine synthase [Acidobacteria bacterium]|nr:methionine synthase [Acidobacteriota bacterium]
MMTAPLDTLRVDQVGSLLRPAWLKEVYTRHGRGEAGGQELGEAQDRAICDVIAKQEALQLPVVTDGEYRRVNFQDSFTNSVTGWAVERETIQAAEKRVADAKPLQRWEMGGFTLEGQPASIRRPVAARLRLAVNQPLQEYQFAKSVARKPVKVTLIDTDRIVERFDLESSRPVYQDIERFRSDVISIERRIVSELVDACCGYIQIDGPSYTRYLDPPSLERMRARGEDPLDNMERSIRADNAVIAGFPGVTFGLHTCRGNQRSMWHRTGTYDAIAERLFNGLGHQRLLLEYDSERAGGFEPLRFVPKGKVAVLGLVSTKIPRVETPDELKRQIEAANRYLPVEQLAVSPQCGFASSILGNLLSEDDQWRKLEVIQRVATDVWGRAG